MTADRMAECGVDELHDVEGLRAAGTRPANMAGMMAKYLATSLAIENVVSEPRVISSCLPISTISSSLVGFGVEVDHVAGLLGRLGAGVHGHADVGLGQRRRVVGAVAGHGDEVAARLLGADAGHLVLGRGLGQEVVDAGLVGDGLAAVSGLSPVIMTVRMPMARISSKRSRDARLHVSLRWMTPSTLVRRRRRPAACRRCWRCRSTMASRSGGTRPPCSSTQRRDASRPRPCGSSGRSQSMPLMRVWAVNGTSSAPAMLLGREAVPVLGEGHDRAALGRLVGQATRAGRPRPAPCSSTPPTGRNSAAMPVAVGDRAGLVEQQRGHVAGRLDRPARHGQHVALHQPVHAGDADGREQRADGGRDQAHQQGDEHRSMRLARRWSRWRTAGG